MNFRMEAKSFYNSDFKRQIAESVAIQVNRNHNLLNSKAEFYRCALPRITLKLGENETRDREEKLESEMEREEKLERKIRSTINELKKNKDRSIES